MFPVGRLEAGLLFSLLVPLLHLALAHPAWGQKDGVITAHNGCYGPTEGARRTSGSEVVKDWKRDEK